jgi:hypothetical protein
MKQNVNRHLHTNNYSRPSSSQQCCILKGFDFLDFSSMKLFSLIWCIDSCIPSDKFFAEKYETKIRRKEIFTDPTLCFIFHFV